MSLSQDDLSVQDAVDAAVRQLVSASHAEGASHIHLPLFYPSGAAVTVSVERVKVGYLVTDEGFAYREAEMVGAETQFADFARIAAQELGVIATARMITAAADRASLAAVIAGVGSASQMAASAAVSAA
ncbi:MAG: hypothetical protein P4L71_09765 [Acetobacteraceae bacterium]|nr:hypothetical protein [Acetobacteraceae bacterium]